MSKKEINWLEIKMCYVTSNNLMSCHTLAALFDVSKSAVANKMKEDDWESDRNEYHKRMIAKIEDISIKHKVARNQRMVMITENYINAGIKQLEERINSGKEKISTKELLKIMEIQRKITDSELGLASGTSKMKKIPKKMSDCTPEELQLIKDGKAYPIYEDDLEYGEYEELS